MAKNYMSETNSQDPQDSSNEYESEVAQAKINLETAKMPWSDLQRFFASGNLIFVDSMLDLTEVALRISEDDATYVQGAMKSGQLAQVTDKQALAWHDEDANLWAVVVKPFVLVQKIK